MLPVISFKHEHSVVRPGYKIACVVSNFPVVRLMYKPNKVSGITETLPAASMTATVPSLQMGSDVPEARVFFDSKVCRKDAEWGGGNGNVHVTGGDDLML